MTLRPSIRSFIMFFFALGFATGLVAQATSLTPSGHELHIVDLFPTQMALTAAPQTANPGSTVVFAAALARTGNPSAFGPTGNVIFTLTPQGGGQPVMSTVAVQNGNAVWSIQPPVGTDTVVAAYQGDLNYTPVLQQTMVTILSPGSPDFDFSFPNPVTVTAGQIFNGNITVKSIDGFNGNVTFNIGSLPSDVTFTMPQPDLQVAAPDSQSQSTVAGTVAFTIGTSATIVTTVSGLLLLGVFGVRQRPRWRNAYVLLAILSAGALTVMVGCAGKRFLQSNGTTPGTYQIPVTGTSGSLTHTHNLELIVLPAKN